MRNDELHSPESLAALEEMLSIDHYELEEWHSKHTLADTERLLEIAERTILRLTYLWTYLKENTNV